MRMRMRMSDTLAVVNVLLIRVFASLKEAGCSASTYFWRECPRSYPKASPRWFNGKASVPRATDLVRLPFWQ